MTRTGKKPNIILVMIIYLAGIFMGAIDTGIVTPARTIIQNNLNVDAQAGIWMITIYTLAYAASIPIMGKLADRYGRKYIYLTSIMLFGIGSLFCGLSQNFGGFSMLIIARVVQAIGGGGILPVATAEFGTTFPPEKRGMALGLVGGVYGVANIFGASAGSAILDIFKDSWQYIFYINLPITLFVVIAGFICLDNNKTEKTSKIDGYGIMILTVMVLSLLYGLKNLDFFNFTETIRNTNVYPFLIAFVVLIPVFIFAEKKAEDPVLNLKYFVNKNIVFTLLISFVSGVVMMGMIFVPQFSENALKIASGSGGYLVIILGIFAGIGAPVSGKLIDKFGAKAILAFGFAISVGGSLFLILVTTKSPSLLTVIISLILIGIGMGFTIGTPLNYMMLANTDEKESNSSLATLSLIRSIGTAIAPAIMVGFISHAGMNVQTNVMNLLPQEIKGPELPYAEEITDEFNKLKSNPNMKDKLGDMTIPDLDSMSTVKVNMSGNSGYKMPEDLIKRMQASDVTTIVEDSKVLSERMFAEMTPGVITKIQDGITKGIDGIGKGIEGMNSAITAQKAALDNLQKVSEMMSKMGNAQLPPNTSIADMIPSQVKSSIPPDVLKELSAIKSIDDLNKKINELNNAMSGTNATVVKMKDLQNKMTVLRDAVPGSFETAKNSYLQEIDNKKEALEKEYQSTLNEGFGNVYLTSAIASVIALILLLFYSRKKENSIEKQ